MSTALVQLSYAPPRPRRRTVRRVIMLVMLLAVAIFTIKEWPTAVHRARTLYWQREAMRFTLPPSHIVMEGGSQQQQQMMIAGGSKDYMAATDLLWPDAVPSMVYFAKPWREFYPLVAASPCNPRAVIYLHERHTVGGKPRLVAVDARYFGRSMAQIDAMAFEPGSATSDPLRLSHSIDMTGFGFVADSRDLRVYAGQSDPSDPSHFTIAYRVDGIGGMMDGWLDSSDRITIALRMRSLYFQRNSDATAAAEVLTPAPASPARSR